MKPWFYRAGLGLGLTAAAAWIAFTNTSLGDYDADAAAPVEALARGDISAYLSAKAIMGPLSILIQAPFSLLGDDPISRFQWACLPCLLAAVALGLYLATLARRRGAGRFAAALIAGLTVVNPISFYAVGTGHPEEILTAALAVGAVAVAAQGHSVRAGLLLGLAVASKQWAVLAVFPLLMALPGGRLRALFAALLPAALLI